MDESPRRAAGGSGGEVVSRSFCRDGSVSAARDREIPGASHTKKIIGKPCAGKLHARFERGFLETGRRIAGTALKSTNAEASGYLSLSADYGFRLVLTVLEAD